MRVLYLFNRPRGEDAEKIRRGEMHDSNFYGMLRLPHFGVVAAYLEPEQYMPAYVASAWRWLVGVYFVHVPLYLALLRSDIVFTSTAFGTQLLHTLFGFRRPKWVMHDFSIMGLLGNESSLRQKVFRFIVASAGGIVTIGEVEAAELKKRFPALAPRIEFIPIGVDLDFFSPRAAEETTDVFAPGLDPCRDYETLFRATAGLHTLVSRSRAIDDMPALPAHVRAEFFSPEKIRDAYASAKVVAVSVDISSGINDAAGTTTIAEAMAMGKPIVATRTPTTQSYIQDGVNGLLVPPRDSNALRAAIERVLSDDDLRARLGEHARAHAQKELDAEVMARRLAEFFKRIAH